MPSKETKPISQLIPLKDRILYPASDVLDRGTSLSGVLDSTVLEVYCDRGECYVVTCSGTHRKHVAGHHYELVPADYEHKLPASQQAMPVFGKPEMVRGRSIN